MVGARDQVVGGQAILDPGQRACCAFLLTEAASAFSAASCFGRLLAADIEDGVAFEHQRPPGGKSTNGPARSARGISGVRK